MFAHYFLICIIIKIQVLGSDNPRYENCLYFHASYTDLTSILLCLHLLKDMIIPAFQEFWGKEVKLYVNVWHIMLIY